MNPRFCEGDGLVKGNIVNMMVYDPNEHTGLRDHRPQREYKYIIVTNSVYFLLFHEP